MNNQNFQNNRYENNYIDKNKKGSFKEWLITLGIIKIPVIIFGLKGSIISIIFLFICAFSKKNFRKEFSKATLIYYLIIFLAIIVLIFSVVFIITSSSSSYQYSPYMGK